MESHALAEQHLVDRAANGDHYAYAELVRPHEPLALRLGYLITRDVQDAEDAVQEALVKTYVSLGRFKRGSPFRPWLLRIVVNEAKDRRRASERRARVPRELAIAAPTVAEPPLDAAVAQSERTKTVLAAISELRDDERLVVGCRLLLGLSEEETAAALATPVGTAKSRFSRGRARLQQALGGLDA